MSEEKKIYNVQDMINEFMTSAKKNIAPIDPLAYQAIVNIVGMITVGLARLNNIDISKIIDKAEQKQHQEQQELENIMTEVNESEA